MIREDRYQNFMDQGFDLESDPPGDGNCQFGPISSQLVSSGIHRTPEMVRNEIIGYLTEHSIPGTCQGCQQTKNTVITSH